MDSEILKNFSKNNLSKRVLSALVMLPFGLYVFYAGGVIFAVCTLILSVLMAYEWINIVRDDRKWAFFGIFYILVPMVSLLAIREHENGFVLIMYLFTLVWATDIGAYLFGIAFGGPKIAPSISPSKTYSGACGGLVLAVLTASLFVAFNALHGAGYIYTGLALSLLAQIGDFFESFIKRKFHVKDSGNIIPGHGGVLDRFDSITTTAPVLFILVALGVL